MITDEKVKEVIPEGGMVILDKEYSPPTDIEIDNFLSSDAVKTFVDNFTYKKESSDCDNAAWDFVSLFSGKGWPVGLAIISGHAITLIINDLSETVWIEPQTGKRVEKPAKLRLTVMP